MGYYPIFVEMSGRKVVVVGGGNVAEGKVKGLLDAGADVTVLAPDLSPELRTLAKTGRIRHVDQAYKDGDVAGFELCFVATDDGAINTEVAREGNRLGVWVNAADDPANCDFILPSLVRQGDVVVAASTGGGSPALARRLREELTAFLAEDYAPLAELLADVRREIRGRGLTVDPESWQRAIDPRFRALVAQRRLPEAREHLLLGLGVAEQPGARAGEAG
jgi:precorrin-2 dehydrogenase / sirohydrochlorin ferrochelatase